MPTLWEMQLECARKAQPGDRWKNKKTGREVQVVGRGKYLTDIMLRHQDGRVTTKQEHYFAYDYYPVNAQLRSSAGAAGVRLERLVGPRIDNQLKEKK